MAENNVTPIRVEKGKALEEYQRAAKRLSKAAWRKSQGMQEIRMKCADVTLRQAEVAALVEFLVDKKLLTTDEFLRRCADSMNAMAKGLENGAAIIVPH